MFPIEVFIQFHNENGGNIRCSYRGIIEAKTFNARKNEPIRTEKKCGIRK
jgi:hypothetical protein